MEALRIDAASQDSAEGMMEALKAFGATVVEDGQGLQVVVSLGRSPGRIVEVLNALEQYVTERADRPARVELQGRRYTLHPVPEPE